MSEPKYSSDEIMQALRETNGLISLAARRLGCANQTIYNRAKKVQAVQQVINESRDELVDIAELALRSAVTGKEAWAVCLVLKTLGKERGYVERQELTGADGKELKIKVTVKHAND